MTAESRTTLVVTAAGLPAEEEDEAPRDFGERYEILGLIGAGGMGNVYKARDRELSELCALKVLRPEIAHDARALDAFRREVRLARRVTHPNVARVYDIGERGGDKILTMELVEGEALSALIARERRLGVARAVEIAVALCAGLDAAHAAGVVHRDLKPDNVLLEVGGRVVITDFGIARSEKGDPRVTQGIVGTPAYMAPEQIEATTVADARADLYALGIILYEMVTGELPFEGATIFAMAAARLLRPPPDPRKRRPDLPERFAAIVLRCLARSPDDRFPSAAAVSVALGALTLPQPSPQPARAPTPVSHPAREKRVAVLPFRNAGAPEHDYLADGLTEDVIDQLSVNPGLRVTSRGVVMRYKGSDRDPREVGRDLGVQVVVDGTVRRSGGGVRISARLASVADGIQLWARRFERPDAELLGVSDDVARAIADALAAPPGAPAPPREADPEAMDLYLRARAAYHQFFEGPGGGCIALFEQALSRAPEDPRILAGYAAARARRWSPDPEVTRSAERAAVRAVELAPSSPQAHAALGMVRYQSCDEVGAVRALRHALRLGPATTEAHDALGRILGDTALLAEARRHLTTAITLEPSIILSRLALARIHDLLGERDEADRIVREVPAASAPYYARILLWRRDVAGAEALLRAPIATTLPGSAQALLGLVARRTTPYEGLEQILAQRAGTPRSRTFCLQLLVEAASFVGDAPRAALALAEAADLGLCDVAWLDRCPLFEDLRREPTFGAAREKIAARAALVEAAYRERA